MEHNFKKIINFICALKSRSSEFIQLRAMALWWLMGNKCQQIFNHKLCWARNKWQTQKPNLMPYETTKSLGKMWFMKGICSGFARWKWTSLLTAFSRGCGNEHRDWNGRMAKWIMSKRSGLCCKYCEGGHKKGRKRCPTYGKTCRSCGVFNHFSKVCKAQQRDDRAGWVNVMTNDGQDEQGPYSEGRLFIAEECIDTVKSLGPRWFINPTLKKYRPVS